MKFLKASSLVVACAFATTLSLASHAEVAGSKSARTLITQKIDETNLVELQGNTHPAARLVKNDRGALPESMVFEHMELQLKRSREQQKALDTLVDHLHKPGDPMFHKWLQPKEFGETFGVSADDIEKITGWLTSHGFTVNTVYASNMVIDFSGTVGQVNEAFHTSIHAVTNKLEEKHLSNISNPKIPAALSQAVEGVVSLNNFFPRPMITGNSITRTGADGKSVRIPVDLEKLWKEEHNGVGGTPSIAVHPDFTYTCPAATCGTALQLFDEAPADFSKIYDLAPLQTATTPIVGTGQTVVVIEDTNMKAADFTTFRTAFLASGSTGTLTQVHPAYTGNTCTNPGLNGAEGEAALDAEWAGAIAPNAAIELASCADASTTFGGLIAVQNLVNTANTPSVMSVSYGECEAVTGATEDAAFNAAYEQAAAQGQSVFVSSGDSLAAVCDGNGAEYSTVGISVNGWGSTPYNVSVGGTDFSDVYAGTTSTYWNTTTSTASNYYLSAKSYLPETPWDGSCANYLVYHNAGYASGEAFCNSTTGEADYLTTGGGSGGPSSIYSKPAYQSGLVGNPSDSVRDLPDIALFASSGAWDQLVVFCMSDTAEGGAPCTYTNGTDTVENSAGGTSFASPQMAGIQALINQKTGEAQGDPNYIMYALAKTAYGSSGSTTCNASNGNAIGTSCVFHDITFGDIDAPCQKGTPNCYTSNSADTYGVLSTSTTSLAIAYPTQTGWDFSTGIGSPDVTNLVNAWAAVSNGAPAMTVSVSNSSITVGTPTVITAKVTGPGSYPTGSVTFAISGVTATTTVALPTVPASGNSACTTTCTSTVSYTYTPAAGVATGSHTVTATYVSPQEQYTTASAMTTLNIAANATTTTVTANPASVTLVSNNTIVLTSVTSYPSTTSTPTGTVAFSNPTNGTFATVNLSTCTISSTAHTATCSYTWLPNAGGTYNVTASYSGDSNFGSSSNTVSVTATVITTALTLNSITPSTITQANPTPTYSLTLTWAGTRAHPTGSFTFSNATLGTPFYTATIASSSCTFGSGTGTCLVTYPNMWSFYANGSYAITATYTGDSIYAASTSGSQTLLISNGDADTTTIALNPTFSTAGTATSTTATVVVTGTVNDGHTAGTVTITGTGSLGTLATITLNTTNCTANNGYTYTCTKALTIPATTPGGSYTITASYAGSVNYLPSSGTATFTVNPATPAVAVSNVSGYYGQTVTLSATDTGSTALAIAPTGTASFTVAGAAVSGTPSCSTTGVVKTCTLAYTITSTTAGTQTIGASFTADTNYTIKSGTGTLTVTASATSTIVTATPSTIAATASTTLKATVADTPQSSVSPTGTVTFKTGTTTLGSCTLSGGTCSISAAGSSFVTGSNTVAATYTPGATAFSASSGMATVTISVSTDTTTTAVTATPSSITGAGSTTLKATVSDSTSGTTTPTGTIAFTEGSAQTSLGGCTLAAGTCSIPVTGSTLGAGSDSIKATYTPGSTAFAPSSGTTTVTVGADLTFTSVSHNFGSVMSGISTTGTENYGVQLTNNSTSSVSGTVVINGAGFTQNNNCGTALAAGAHCEIIFTFSPAAAQTYSATWSLTGQPAGAIFAPSNGGTLTGTGVASAGVALTTNKHNFGTQTVGTTSAVFGAVLTNSTSTAITLAVAAPTGNTGSFVTYLNNCGTSLGAGASCNLQYEFKPTATGSVSEFIGVTANGGSTTITAAGSATAGLTLVGSGQ